MRACARTRSARAFELELVARAPGEDVYVEDCGRGATGAVGPQVGGLWRVVLSWTAVLSRAYGADGVKEFGSGSGMVRLGETERLLRCCV